MPYSNEDIIKEVNQLIQKYNPDGLSPFPFEKIESENNDLNILMASNLPDDISGAISYRPQDSGFVILVNEKKSKVRQYFTVAHEAGHYFLHKNEIKEELIIDSEKIFDNGVLYRRDQTVLDQLEREANQFAACLIMPEGLVKKAWENLKTVEDCAKVFGVSLEAMAIRLSRLGLL